MDWGHEDAALAAALGVAHVYSFHMTLGYSRDPFCAFTTSQDLATFWGAHVAAFHHFGGVPGSIVYDRTKTVIARHVAPGKAVPLHPLALASPTTTASSSTSPPPAGPPPRAGSSARCSSCAST